MRRYSLIPLAIFYSSLTKLFLLFLLSIWQPSENTASQAREHWWSGTTYESSIISSALGILDEDKLDREWVVRNVLGGMAAGFGLRGKAVLHFQHALLANVQQSYWIAILYSQLRSSWLAGLQKRLRPAL